MGWFSFNTISAGFCDGHVLSAGSSMGSVENAISAISMAKVSTFDA